MAAMDWEISTRGRPATDLRTSDNVNYNGYANSRYTIAVAAIDHDGVQSYYSEPGAPILVTAYSCGSTVGRCHDDAHGARATCRIPRGPGTTRTVLAARRRPAPLAAGVIALMLEANPNLTCATCSMCWSTRPSRTIPRIPTGLRTVRATW